MDLDVLCMVAHRDDADILAGGTIIKLKDQGYRVGIVDFSQGEMGTRGDSRQRAEEAECAARILGVDARINLEFPDAHIENTVENRRRVVRAIREFRPLLVITHDQNNRNPDHTHTGHLVRESCFTAGLLKYETGQPPHRPNKIIYGMEYYESAPTFLVDISAQFERKMQAVACYRSQVCGSCVDGPPTYISSDRFFREIEARMRYYGSRIHSDYAEAFRMETVMEVRDLVQEISLRALIPGQGRKE
jgi:N-acetylglucosamine malate deacetylase 1